MHTPVLLKETIEGLDIKKDGLYIDATIGEGGHLKEIAKLGVRVLGIDADATQIERLKNSLAQEKNIKLIAGNFSEIERIAKENNFYPAQGVLFDLGLSMHQIKYGGRGFSYKSPEEPLDMRLGVDQASEKAEDLLNELSEEKLYEIFAKYSEEIHSLAIAEAVVRTRAIRRIGKVGELVAIIKNTSNGSGNMTIARIFQALRIAVNAEFENLEKALEGALNILTLGGKIAVISFHSGEDRIVKNFIKTKKLHEAKPIKGSREKSFERSAILRIFWS